MVMLSILSSSPGLEAGTVVHATNRSTQEDISSAACWCTRVLQFVIRAETMGQIHPLGPAGNELTVSDF